MKTFASANPDQLVLRSTTSVGVALTGMFFLGGAGVLYFVKIPLNDTTESPMQIAAYVAAGLGALILLARRGAVIDRSKGTVRSWCGLLLPMFSRTKKVDPQAIRITRETHSCKGHKSTINPIRLLGRGNYVDIDAPDDAVRAWAIAQSIATFLGVNVIDESEGREPQIGVL